MLLRYFSSHGLGLLPPHIAGRFPHSDIYDSKRSLAPHRSLSQPNTSFILFFTQGIHFILLIRFVAICKIILFRNSNKRNILYYCVKYLQLYLAVYTYNINVLLQCCGSIYTEIRVNCKTFFDFFSFFFIKV